MPVHQHPVAVPNSKDPILGLPLDLALIGRLKASFQLVHSKGPRLAEIFYSKLFSAAPQLRSLFRSDADSQARKLSAALEAVVHNLESPAENSAMLAELGKRHAGYGARPEHYDLVVSLLVESMSEVLGSATDTRSLEEWRMALRLISDQMIASTRAPVESPPASL
jgi:nitric oxide dioxygenase